jgi:hypothetical protein
VAGDAALIADDGRIILSNTPALLTGDLLAADRETALARIEALPWSVAVLA